MIKPSQERENRKQSIEERINQSDIANEIRKHSLAVSHRYDAYRNKRWIDEILKLPGINSQKQIAEALGVVPATIANLKNSKKKETGDRVKQQLFAIYGNLIEDVAQVPHYVVRAEIILETVKWLSKKLGQKKNATLHIADYAFVIVFDDNDYLFECECGNGDELFNECQSDIAEVFRDMKALDYPGMNLPSVPTEREKVERMYLNENEGVLVTVVDEAFDENAGSCRSMV